MTRTPNPISGLFVVFLGLFIGVLLWLLVQAQQFYTLSAGTVHAAAQTVPLPKQEVLKRQFPDPLKTDKEVKYRKFFLTRPEAKKVELRGDFNRWGKDPITLTPYKKGYFETSVALAAGEYQYEFVADGVPLPDPINKDRRTLPDGREICIKTVR